MEPVFTKLLEMSISASWLVLVILGLRILLKNAPRWIHVALWALVALRLICPFSPESQVSLNPMDLTQRIMADIPNSYVGPSSTYWDYLPEYQEAVDAGIEPVYAGEGHSYVVTGRDHLTPVITIRSILSLVWAIGLAGMSAYAWISYLYLKRKVSASLDLGNGVCICDYIDTPFILGIIRPKIYLPSVIAPDSASHVLAHERSHIARKDHWWKPLGYTLLAVHWFNPLLWLAYILLCKDIELACDEKVIRDMELSQKKAYSEALLVCSVSRRHIAACPLAFGEVGVKERVKTVLNYKKPGFWMVLTAIVALIFTAVCFLTDPVTEPESPFGKHYRINGLSYQDATPIVSSMLYNNDDVFLLTDAKSMLALPGMGTSYAYSVARFTDTILTEANFDVLFRKDPAFGEQLRKENFLAWEYRDKLTGFQNYEDFCYLLQQKDGTLYFMIGQWWTAEFREGESLIQEIYTLHPIETDDPFASSSSPFQWTLNLRQEHIHQVQMTTYNPEGIPQRLILGADEQSHLLDILNALRPDQIIQGKLIHEPLVTAYLGCKDETGWNADRDVLLQYDGSLVRMVFSTLGATRYPEEENKEWIIRSDALNSFLSVYAYKPEVQDPFSDPDNAYQWCRNISAEYVISWAAWADVPGGRYISTPSESRKMELLQILREIPETAFERADYPADGGSVNIEIYCRNVWNEDTNLPTVILNLVGGEVYYTLGTDWTEPYQTWKINDQPLREFLLALEQEDKSGWTYFRVHSPAVDTHKYVKCDVSGLEISVPELKEFEYAVTEEGIRFKPKDVEGWILIQYRTEPFAVCGTGLVTAEVSYKNGKYKGIEGYYDGSSVWSFIDITAALGDAAYNVVFLNEDQAPWVAEYFTEITEIICELGFQVTG